MNFEDKVRSMKASEIIMAMVEGLRNPKCVIDMGTFGGSEDGICFGCAATNAVMQISGVVFTPETINIRDKAVSSSGIFFSEFEDSIDFLRLGIIMMYNGISERIGVKTIEVSLNERLPYLRDNFTEYELLQYEELAKKQQEFENNVG